jgi:hypothetical protein
MIQTFNYVNSNSSTRPQTMIQVSSAASSVCGYYFKDKGEMVRYGIYPATFSKFSAFSALAHDSYDRSYQEVELGPVHGCRQRWAKLQLLRY